MGSAASLNGQVSIERSTLSKKPKGKAGKSNKLQKANKSKNSNRNSYKPVDDTDTSPLEENKEKSNDVVTVGYVGEVDAKGKKNGRGTFIYANGDRYEGDWIHNKKHGVGTYTFSNGDVYDGQFKSGVKHGSGVYRYAIGEVYHGDYANNLMEGTGTYKYQDGAKYEGEFKANAKHGKGIYTYPDGAVQEGLWVLGEARGPGKYAYPNGDRYEGPFEAGKMHGSGCLTLVSSSQTPMQGVFQQGLLTATFSLPPATGSSPGPGYSGPLNPQGQKEGLGSFLYPNGDRYRGQWQRDLKHGPGEYEFANGDRYRGAFREGLKNDEQGLYRFRDGSEYRGAFRGDRMTGPGLLTRGDRQLRGQFLGGVPHGPCDLWERSEGGSWGLRYRGAWDSGRPQGQGSVLAGPGEVVPEEEDSEQWESMEGRAVLYIGGFLHGRMQGQGRYRFPRPHNPAGPARETHMDSWLSYSGGLEEGLLQGHGTLRLREGLYRGAFLRGRRHGPGTLTYTNGLQHQARYRAGQLDWARGAFLLGEGLPAAPPPSDLAARAALFTGSIVDGLREGPGELQLSSPSLSSSSFQGEFRGGLPLQGLLLTGEGHRYRGAFLQGLPHGPGHLTTSDGSVYEGSFERGLSQGRGRITSPDGSVFQGCFEEGLMQGPGRLVLPSGARYEGSFHRGVMQGRGRLRYANGLLYRGSFRGDRRHGHGTLHLPASPSRPGSTHDLSPDDLDADWDWTPGPGCSEYRGLFHEGLMQGPGEYRYASGARYEGAFHMGVMQGLGALYGSDGALTFRGAFLGGHQTGPGLLLLPDGSRYEGAFLQGRMTGKGTLSEPGGGQFSGEFLDDVQHGLGVHRDQEGRETLQQWRHGQLLSQAAAAKEEEKGEEGS